jgi:microcystin-dependent protein
MSDNFIGEIRAFAFNMVPKDWHKCDGTLLQIQQYSALFSLIGIAFGGDGVKTFALPNLQSRTIIGSGTTPSGFTYANGNTGGQETVTLTNVQTNHNHSVHVEASPGDTTIPTNILAIPNVTSIETETINIYATAPTTSVFLNTATISTVGGSLPHENMQPFLVINYYIAMVGIYPIRP